VSSARGFASDNSATVHPAVLAAIARINVGHTFGYGHDGYTRRVEAQFAEHFGTDARVFFVFNGTAANVLALRATCRPWEAAICAATAHLNVDECAAPRGDRRGQASQRRHRARQADAAARGNDARAGRR
jgi:threonine aldolase